MELRVPHQIIYHTPESVSVSEVVDALRGAERVLLDIGPVLGGFFPDLEVSARVYVKEISESESLKEVLWVALAVAYQEDLEKEVPPLIDHILGTHLSGKYNAVVTVAFLTLLFYGADFVYKRLTSAARLSKIDYHLDEFVDELSRELHVPKERVRQVLSNRYSNMPRIRLLAKAAISVFVPSKRQNNSAITVVDRKLESDVVAEIPSDAQILELEDNDTSAHVENVRIELHAQDVDRSKAGWAAVIPEISPKRMKMSIYPGVEPKEIYTKREITGDIILISKKDKSGRVEPYMFHLVRAHDDL